MRASSIKHYKEAWEYHIQQLSILALDANIQYIEYVETKAQLTQWLDKAITNLRNIENGKA